MWMPQSSSDTFWWWSQPLTPLIMITFFTLQSSPHSYDVLGDFHIWLVVDLPLWKIWVRQLGMKVSWDDEIPHIWENEKCSKLPTRYSSHTFGGSEFPVLIDPQFLPRRLSLPSSLPSQAQGWDFPPSFPFGTAVKWSATRRFLCWTIHSGW